MIVRGAGTIWISRDTYRARTIPLPYGQVAVVGQPITRVTRIQRRWPFVTRYVTDQCEGFPRG